MMGRFKAGCADAQASGHWWRCRENPPIRSGQGSYGQSRGQRCSSSIGGRPQCHTLCPVWPKPIYPEAA